MFSETFSTEGIFASRRTGCFCFDSASSSFLAVPRPDKHRNGDLIGRIIALAPGKGEYLTRVILLCIVFGTVKKYNIGAAGCRSGGDTGWFTVAVEHLY